MGVLNITPDSFSDGGRYSSTDTAFAHAQAMIAAGADIIDIGGESSRPGAAKVSTGDELTRVLPVIQQIRAHSDIMISIDTWKPSVMREAVSSGASMINDIKALQSDGAIDVAVESGVPICLMHMQGQPETMQQAPHYPKGILAELQAFFAARLAACDAAGIARDRLIIDPGFGFGKTVEHNLAFLKSIKRLQRLEQPILLGVSRKSTLGHVLDADVDDRLSGGLSAAVYAVLNGVGIIRTHDVKETKQAFMMLEAIHTAHMDEDVAVAL